MGGVGRTVVKITQEGKESHRGVEPPVPSLPPNLSLHLRLQDNVKVFAALVALVAIATVTAVCYDAPARL